MPLITFLWIGLSILGSSLFLFLPKEPEPAFRQVLDLIQSHAGLDVSEKVSDLNKAAGKNPNPQLRALDEDFHIKLSDRIVESDDPRLPYNKNFSIKTYFYYLELFKIEYKDNIERGDFSEDPGLAYKYSKQQYSSNTYQNKAADEFPSSSRRQREPREEAPENSQEAVEDSQDSDQSEMKDAFFNELYQIYRDAYGTKEDNQEKLDLLTEKLFQPNLNAYENKLGVLPKHATYYSYFISCFFTPSFLMILLNLLVFYHLAPLLEDLWGRAVMLVFLITAAGISLLAYNLFAPEGFPPLVGLLGLTSAIFAATAIHYPHRQVTFTYLFISSYHALVRIRFWILVPIWPLFWFCYLHTPQFLMKLAHFSPFALRWLETFARYLSGTSEASGYTMLSFLCLIPAMLYGFAFAGLAHYAQFQKRFNPLPTDLMNPSDRYQTLIDEAVEKGDKPLVAELLAKAYRELPNDFELHLRYWRNIVTARQVKEQKTVGLRLFPILLVRAQIDPALSVWEELSSAVGCKFLPLSQVLTMCQQLVAAERSNDVKRILERSWSESISQSAEVPTALVAFFQLWAQADPTESRHALKDYLQSRALSASTREELLSLEHKLQFSSKSVGNLREEEALPLAASQSFLLADRVLVKTEQGLRVTHVTVINLQATAIGLQVADQTRTFEWTQFKGLAFGRIVPNSGRTYCLLDLMMSKGGTEAGNLHSLRILSHELPAALAQKYNGNLERALYEMALFMSQRTGFSYQPDALAAGVAPPVFASNMAFEMAVYATHS